MARDPIATLPNLVSLSRVAMAAVFPLLTGAEDRLLLIAAAATTDVADGWLARSRGSVSRSGALIDPLADRCFVLVAMFVLWWAGTISSLATFALVARDIAVIAAWAATRWSTRFRDFTFMARPAGKVVTALQFATLATVYLVPEWLNWFVAAVALASVVSIADYTRTLWRGRHAAASLIVGVLSALGATACLATSARAQGFRFTPAAQPEIRVQLVVSDGSSAVAGIGLNVPVGYYVRLAGGLAAGSRLGRSGARRVEIDVAVRFLADPFHEQRWGPYAALGVRGAWEEGRKGRPAITLAVGTDLLGAPGSWRPAIEVGIGGGARVGLAFKPMRRAGR